MTLLEYTGLNAFLVMGMSTFTHTQNQCSRKLYSLPYPFQCIFVFSSRKQHQYLVEENDAFFPGRSIRAVAWNSAITAALRLSFSLSRRDFRH